MSTAEPEKKPSALKKNWWVAVSLIGIFLLVLFLNSYFNISSGATFNSQGQGLDKYYLSGPDPYYNMRLVNQTLYGENKGHFPYYSTIDPLLNYPLGRSGARPPLLSMSAIAFSRVLTPFMKEVDAVGYSMQFVPALFGALLVFPVYFIGEALFGKKAGLVAAFLIALIPAHISSGHGSAYSLFDHDSLNLLLYFLAFLFVIKGVKDKDIVKSTLYALLAGVSLGALSMVWVEGEFLYVVIAVYAVVQILIDIFMNKLEMKVPITVLVALSSGYLISLPVRAAQLGGFTPDTPLFLCLALAASTLIYFIFNRKKIPWTISLPTIFGIGIAALVFLYFINVISSVIPFFSRLSSLSNIIYGKGIYGNKVSMTIAEASTYNISHTVMSFGPALYWLGWAGLLFLIYYYYKNKQRRDYFFIIVLFIVDIWLTGISGRFINDLVPLVALLGGWVVWIVVDKIDYKQMVRNIRSAGGGFHGLRRGIKFLHIIGILFIALLVLLPNAYIAFDAAVPVNKKTDVFGSGASEGAFGLSTGKEAYWMDAYNWLNKQDTDITDPTKRPAFISWWDYGFYEVAVGAHPTVADNFQDGIPTAANFHTATSEKEAVAVWIIRLLGGDIMSSNGKLSEGVKLVFKKYLSENDSVNITKWMENSASSPSHNVPIGENYDKNLSKEWRVGAQYVENAIYHDVSKILVNSLSDEQITWFYHDIQEATGFSIRYYGVEGYDKQIFSIFGFLADKSLIYVGGSEDDLVQMKIALESGKTVSLEEFRNMNKEELEEDPPVINNGRYNIRTYYKDAYFDTMFYRTYIGLASGTSGQKQESKNQFPCYNMKHFCAEYISPYAYPGGMSTVVIAKYYEGALINGSVSYLGNPLQAEVVVQKNVDHQLYRLYLGENYSKIYPSIDHDAMNTENGMFNLIAPAGSITLQIRRNTELGGNAFILKNVTFNSTTDPELFSISDDEAMRKNGTNYERIVNITIDAGNIEGYAYLDKDNIDGYNVSSDEPLSNVNVTLYEIQQFTDTGTSIIKRANLTTDEKGHYNASGLMPGYYQLKSESNDFVIREDIIAIYSGDNYYNISKAKPGSVEGVAYYDTNQNEKYNVGEEISDVKIDIIYEKLGIDGETIIDKILVNTTLTDSNGHYSFSSLLPGQYIINATKSSEYMAEEEVTINENETASFNISLSLTPVTVNGYTKYGDKNTGGISIVFSPDKSVENNTATANSMKSNETTGFYEVMLAPGAYNVTASKTEGQTTVYSFKDRLVLQKGEVTRLFDIYLTKESITVSGTISDDETNVGNINVSFTQDESIEENTAKFARTRVNENGVYQLELMPGTYNVSVNETIKINGQNMSYSYTGHLVLEVGQEIETYNIKVAKEES